MKGKATPCRKTECFAPQMWPHKEAWCSGPFSELISIPLRVGETDFGRLAWPPSQCRHGGPRSSSEINQPFTSQSAPSYGVCTTRETHPDLGMGNKTPEKTRKCPEWARKSLSFGLDTRTGKAGSESSVLGLVKLDDASCLAPLPLTSKPS